MRREYFYGIQIRKRLLTMSDKYKNKYRISSARKQSWDYGSNAGYYITICTKNRKHYFGKIRDKKMQFSEIGQIAHKYFQEIPQHFPFVVLGEFVIMPDHVHGIINIDKRGGDGIDTNDVDGACGIVETGGIDVTGGIDETGGIDVTGGIDGTGGIVETPNLGVSMDNPKSPARKNDKWKSGNLGVIINQYKRICTINARRINPDFAWQTRYHDRIIRNEIEYRIISAYIINNPSKWRDHK